MGVIAYSPFPLDVGSLMKSLRGQNDPRGKSVIVEAKSEYKASTTGGHPCSRQV